jgi:N6-adenosine-specific RNA methylase IME4
MKLPAKYSAAKQALAAARKIDEVKDIRDKSIAMQVYAFQAKDAQLAADAAELKDRATRRIGELMEEQRSAGKMAKGARDPGTQRGTTRVAEKPASLEKQGVDKDLAHRARRYASMPKDKFEHHVAKTRSRAVAIAEGDKAIIAEVRAERQKEKQVKRKQREKELARHLEDLPDRKYGVIYADPEWQWEPYSRETGMDRAAANHYPTNPTNTIMQRKVADIAADDCALFLWATVPMLPQALAVMSAWGFEYKSHFIWSKDKIGTGYWNRNQHELLLVGTRGNVPAPSPGTQWPSVIEAPITKHSEKPERFAELVESYFPVLPKIELNRRGAPRDGWDAWGNETIKGDAGMFADVR